MKEIIFVSIGGFLGAICRYFFSRKIQERHNTGFPFGTLMVNLIGAFLLGWLMGSHVSGQIYSLFGIGFMGAFTTFSTLNLELEQLRKTKKSNLYFGYLFASYILGITFAYLGLVLGKIL